MRSYQFTERCMVEIFWKGVERGSSFLPGCQKVTHQGIVAEIAQAMHPDMP